MIRYGRIYVGTYDETKKKNLKSIPGSSPWQLNASKRRVCRQSTKETYDRQQTTQEARQQKRMIGWGRLQDARDELVTRAPPGS